MECAGLPQSTAPSPRRPGPMTMPKTPPVMAEDTCSPQNRDAREQGFRPGHIPAHGAVFFCPQTFTALVYGPAASC